MSQPGDRYQADVGFDRLDAAAAQNAAQGAHLWTMIASFGLTSEEAAHAREGVVLLMDEAHLLAVTPIGCHICEKVYEEALKDERCKGNPERYASDGEPCYSDGTMANGGRWK